LIDAHAHLSAPSISGTLFEVVAGLLKGGLSRVINGGVDPDDWTRQLEISKTYPDFIGTAAGIHPWTVRDRNENEIKLMFDRLRAEVGLFDLIGEVGLDFYKDKSPEQKAKQLKWCNAQLDLAISLEKAVILHVVKAHDVMLGLLNEHRRIRGVIHGFNGGRELAYEYARRGFLISVGSRFLRNKSSKDLLWLKDMPFVIESDLPRYQTTVFEAKNMTDEWLGDLGFSAKKLADAFGVSQAKIWELSDANVSSIISGTKYPA